MEINFSDFHSAPVRKNWIMMKICCKKNIITFPYTIYTYIKFWSTCLWVFLFCFFLQCFTIPNNLRKKYLFVLIWYRKLKLEVSSFVSYVYLLYQKYWWRFDNQNHLKHDSILHLVFIYFIFLILSKIFTVYAK